MDLFRSTVLDCNLDKRFFVDPLVFSFCCFAQGGSAHSENLLV